MKQRYFYIAVTAVTAVLCLAGCGEDNNSSFSASNNKTAFAAKGASPAAGVYAGGADKVVAEKHSPGEKTETAVTTLTPFQTFVRMTALFGKGNDDENDDEIEYEDKNTDDDEEDDDNWFPAHSPFNMDEGEEDSFFEGTWYRFNNDGETRRTVVTMYEHITTQPGLKDSVKEPDKDKKKNTNPAG